MLTFKKFSRATTQCKVRKLAPTRNCAKAEKFAVAMKNHKRDYKKCGRLMTPVIGSDLKLQKTLRNKTAIIKISICS